MIYVEIGKHFKTLFFFHYIFFIAVVAFAAVSFSSLDEIQSDLADFSSPSASMEMEFNFCFLAVSRIFLGEKTTKIFAIWRSSQLSPTVEEEKEKPIFFSWKFFRIVSRPPSILFIFTRTSTLENRRDCVSISIVSLSRRERKMKDPQKIYSSQFSRVYFLFALISSSSSKKRENYEEVEMTMRTKFPPFCARTIIYHSSTKTNIPDIFLFVSLFFFCLSLRTRLRLVRASVRIVSRIALDSDEWM